jgi:hypothetical protein
MSTFHTVALNRGIEGFRNSDFTTAQATDGAAFTSPGVFFFGMQDGQSVTTKDVFNALRAIERFFLNAQQVVGTAFDVNNL